MSPAKKHGTRYRPRRSVLYMPSSNERALEKAKSLPCDALILDLEDAVAPDAKEAAREAACAAVKSGEYGRKELIIRVNALGTDWHYPDMMAACKAGPAGILVPKVNSAKEVHDLVREMERYKTPKHTKLWAMIETPRSVLDVGRIAAASDRLAVLVMGTNDLVKELDAQHLPGRVPIVPALALAVLSAKASGLFIIDGVYNDVRDPEGFAVECAQGRSMGFDGKTLIHPDQVGPCNEAFSPSDEQVADARGLIDAFDAAVAEQKAVATYKGKLVEHLHVTMAEKVLANREAIDLLG